MSPEAFQISYSNPTKSIFKFPTANIFFKCVQPHTASQQENIKKINRIVYNSNYQAYSKSVKVYSYTKQLSQVFKSDIPNRLTLRLTLISTSFLISTKADVQYGYLPLITIRYCKHNLNIQPVNSFLEHKNYIYYQLTKLLTSCSFALTNLFV